MLVTPLYAGLLAIWYFLLSIRVVQQRGHGVSLGDGGDQELLRRIRGHGNFAEYVPLILVMMALLELGKYSSLLLHALGLSLLLARVLHGVALSFTGSWKFGRFYGTLLTFVLLLVCGGLCVHQGLNGLRLQ